MEINARVEGYMATAQLSAIQLREALSQVPGSMGETTTMMAVVERTFSGIDLYSCSPEELIAARKQEFQGNELAYWTEDGGLLDENAGLHYQAAERGFYAHLEELNSPGYCLNNGLGFCNLAIERIDGEMAAVQAELEDLESAKVGIADDTRSVEADIANFRGLGWLHRRRRRRQLQGFLRDYRGKCRDALLIDICYQVRLRCADILGRVKSLIEAERVRTAGLVDEVSHLVADLAARERELEEFNYDGLVPNGQVLLEPGDLGFYFANYRPRREDQPVSDHELSEGILTGLYRRMGSMRGYVDRVRSDIGPALLELSEGRFSSLGALDVEDVLEMKYADSKAGRDIKRLLSQLSSRIDESGRFLKISSLEKTGQDRKIAVRCISVNDGESSRLAREWLPGIVHNEGAWNIVDGFSDTEMTFYQTEHAYPIHSVTTVKELYGSYKACSRRKSENIFHLYPEYADLPELIPFNHRHALEVFHKAAAIGILSREDGIGWVYSQNGDRISLGSDRKGILDFLNSNQKVISELDGEFRGRLLREGMDAIMPRILQFAEAHRDGDDAIDPDMLQEILLRIDGESANGGYV